MNRDDIVRMAREAGFNACNGFSLLIVRHSNGSWVDISEELTSFAALVAAAEREACAKVCYELPWKDMGRIPSNLAFAAEIRARGTK